MDITFRKITKADVPNLVRWQFEPEVLEWYWDVQGKTHQELVEKWSARASSLTSKTDRYIITVDGQDIGEIQDYLLDDYPDDLAEVGIPDAAGVDLLIGEPDWRNRGVGTALLQKFVDEVVFSRPTVKTCIIDPEPRNLRAIRCYEKVGFQYVRTYRSESNNVGVYLMRLDRASR